MSIEELKAKLDALNYLDGSALTRKDLIDTLKVIRDLLDDILADTIFAEWIEIHLQHKAIGVLDSGIDALKDLDNGVVHEALKSAPTNRGAALTTEQKRLDTLLVDNVTIFQHAKGFRTRREAEDDVAKRLTKAGKKRQGEEITAKMLKSLRNHPKN
jgi:hypothetical protein